MIKIVKKLPLFFFLSLLLFSCDKQGYKTFTETDAGGNVIADDPTDWSKDDKWKNGIDELIASDCELAGIGSATSVTIFPAYPNPAAYSTNFVIEVGDSCLFRAVIVDKYNSVYSQFCRHLDIGINEFALDLISFADAIEGRYRLYYDFSDESNTVFYKGHGDIVRK